MSFAEKAFDILGSIVGNEDNLVHLEKRLSQVVQVVPFVGAGLSFDFGYPTWEQFLREAAAELRLGPSVESLLKQQAFEDVAEVMLQEKPSDFDEFIESRFSEEKLNGPVLKGAVRQLTRFACGVVLTTNFDHVLELAFQEADRGFLHKLHSGHIRKATEAIHLKERVLLKLHGDYTDPISRVLTRHDYRRVYGTDKAADVNLNNPDFPLPIILSQVLGACPLLFLGCSLKTDRTTRVIGHIAKKFQGAKHFALLSAEDNTDERKDQLREWNIYPLFFPEGDYGKIEQFLAYLADKLQPMADQVFGTQMRGLPKPQLTGFIERPGKYKEAKQLILKRETGEVTALTGPTGFGKTTLAKALYYDQEINKAFGDGVFWIGLGQTPNILESLGSLYYEVKSANLPTSDVHKATLLVKEALEKRSILLVIDRIEKWADIKMFLEASPDASHLITTQKHLGSTRPVYVDEMKSEESIKLLLRGTDFQGRGDLSDKQRSLLEGLAVRLGNWPPLLELANRMINKHLQRRRSESEKKEDSNAQLTETLDFVMGKYDSDGIDVFDKWADDQNERAASKRIAALAKSIKINLELLKGETLITNEALIINYRALAVFPDEASIPYYVAADLWNVDLAKTEDALVRLGDVSLLKCFVDDKTFRLHKVFRDCLRQQVIEATAQDEEAAFHEEKGLGPTISKSSLKALHAQLLNCWFKGWPSRCNLPHPYAWRWIISHAKNAGEDELVKELLLDPQWIEAKLKNDNLESLIADYDRVQPGNHYEPGKTHSGEEKLSEPHRLLQRALIQSSHVITRDSTQLPVQLYARILGVEEPTIERLKDQLRTQLSHKSGHIVPRWPPSLTQADSELLRTLEGHNDAVMALALAGNGNILISGCADGSIKTWNLGTGHETDTWAGHPDSISSLALSDDGSRLASCSHSEIRVWDLNTKKQIFPRNEPPCEARSVALSANGRILAFTSPENTITIVDLALGTIKTFPLFLQEPQSWKMTPDGSTLVFSSLDTTIRVHPVGEGQESWHDHAGAKWLALSGDGLKLASARSDGVKIWFLGKKNQDPTLLRLLARDVTSLAFDLNGSTLVAGSSDRTLTLWKLRDSVWSAPTLIGNHTGEVTSVSLSRDGSRLISASLDKTIKIWDVSNDLERKSEGTREIERHAREVVSVALNGKAQRLVSSCCDTVKIWVLQDKTVQPLTGRTGKAISWVSSSKGRSFVASADNDIIKIWDPYNRDSDIEKSVLLELKGHSAEITALVINENGDTLVSAAKDNTIRTWDVRISEEQVREVRYPKNTLMGHQEEVTAVASNTDASIVASGSIDQTVHILHLNNGKIRILPHGVEVRSIALSGDGCTLVSGSADKIIRIWDLTKEPPGMRPLPGHKAGVQSVVLSEDGYTLVSGSRDSSIRVWNLSNSDNDAFQSAFFADAPILCMDLSSGNNLGAGDESGRIHVFDLLPCQARPVAKAASAT